MDNKDYYAEGKAFAEQMWMENTPSSNDELIRFVDKLRSKCADEYGNMMNGHIDGMFSYVFEKELEKLDIVKFNASYESLLNLDEYEDCIYYIEDLLPTSPDMKDCGKGPAITISPKYRPNISKDSDNGFGKIGRLYWFEAGMHMWFPYCDVFTDYPPYCLLEEKCSLLYSNVIVSEVLIAIQATIDPEHKNTTLSEKIDKSKSIEEKMINGLYDFLAENGLAVICLKEVGCTAQYLGKFSGDISNIFLTSDGYVNAVINDDDADLFGYSNSKILLTSQEFYHPISQIIKEVIYKAKGLAIDNCLK